jgi:hypothetical protein
LLEPIFYKDKEVARLMGMSPAWVRVQRFKRRHGEDHFLDLEPRYISSCPRYVADEVQAFVKAIALGGIPND